MSSLAGTDRSIGKKLKKRLEDLERRAGSSSASPEQKHEELPHKATTPSSLSLSSASQRQRSTSSHIRRDHTPEILAQQYVLPSEDRGMFSQQFTRQLSTSPPPFSYPSIPQPDSSTYSTYPPVASFCSLPSNGTDIPLYPHYAHALSQAYAVPSMTSPPVKQEFYGDDEINPFSMSYASINELPSYQEIPPYVRYQRTQSYPTQRG